MLMLVYVSIDVVVEMFHVLNGCCAACEDNVCEFSWLVGSFMISGQVL